MRGTILSRSQGDCSDMDENPCPRGAYVLVRRGRVNKEIKHKQQLLLQVLYYIKPHYKTHQLPESSLEVYLAARKC